jgi:hypothetical protein
MVRFLAFARFPGQGRNEFTYRRGEFRMKPWQLCTALTLGFGALAGSSALRPLAAPAAGPTWISDYEAARAEARSTGKPLFVAFR